MSAQQHGQPLPSEALEALAALLCDVLEDCDVNENETFTEVPNEDQ